MLRSIMTPRERAKEERYLFHKDKLTCLVARGLLRTSLSRYAPVSPGQWRFVENEYGRPELSGVQRDFDLRFNLSHTQDLVACAITLGREVGIDVEFLGRRTRGVDIADRFFSESEVRALHTFPKEQQRDRFFDYWTLKESYIKARGMGLAIPLGSFSLDVESNPIAIRFAPELHDDPNQWQFRLENVSKDHRLALAVHSPDPVAVHMEWTVPRT